MASAPVPLAGQLLLAHPGLRDPNFRRSIIHLVEHDDEQGTLGFILNRPTGQTLGDIASGQLSPALAAVPVLLGGPVAPQRVIIARLRWEDALQELRFECIPDFADLEGEDGLAGDLRAFLGYSGWGEDQLSGELEENAWLVHAPHPATLNANTATWKELLGGLGPKFRLLAEQPDDPSLN